MKVTLERIPLSQSGALINNGYIERNKFLRKLKMPLKIQIFICETLEQEQASGAAAGTIWDAACSSGQDLASGDSAPETVVNVPRRTNPAPILPLDEKYPVLTVKGRPICFMKKDLVELDGLVVQVFSLACSHRLAKQGLQHDQAEESIQHIVVTCVLYRQGLEKHDVLLPANHDVVRTCPRLFVYEFEEVMPSVYDDVLMVYANNSNQHQHQDILPDNMVTAVAGEDRRCDLPQLLFILGTFKNWITPSRTTSWESAHTPKKIDYMSRTTRVTPSMDSAHTLPAAAYAKKMRVYAAKVRDEDEGPCLDLPRGSREITVNVIGHVRV
uniref:Uncharacterized protein n=1 Tax=Oryza sativa subsp. japonica TaxID=39947 RepID=Q69M68_ORYSJ|nr:hypothetical protein [Oryza sativa Japonica Group]